MGLSLRCNAHIDVTLAFWLKDLLAISFRDVLRKIYRGCGLAVSPGKPRVPYCEERPGAAHSRRDQMCIVGWR